MPKWHSKKKVLPYVFTGHGVPMLSSVLKIDIAAEVNISIRSFIDKLNDVIKNV